MFRTRSVGRLFGLVIAIVVGLGTTFTIQAQTATGGGGSAVAQGDKVVSKVISAAEQSAALRRTTREVISKAQPLKMPVQRGPAEVDAPALTRPDRVGAPGRSAAGAPAADADRVARAAYPRDWAALEKPSRGEDATLEQPADEMAGTSQVYTSYIANYHRNTQGLYPHKWIGRLAFSTPSGTSYCSGTSISGNVVLTAAHCLYDTTNNQWYSNWVFAPTYRLGYAPYGTFAATSCTILTTWVNLSGSYSINAWAPYDVGVCNMGTNSAGSTLNNAVGWMGRQWNWPYVRHFHDLGYPFRDYNQALLPDAGQYLRTCVAESFQQTTEVRGMGCNLGGGISGGPWMIGYALGAVSGAADGVNSGLYVGTQNIYAGRFNDNNIVLLCNAVGC